MSFNFQSGGSQNPSTTTGFFQFTSKPTTTFNFTPLSTTTPSFGFGTTSVSQATTIHASGFSFGSASTRAPFTFSQASSVSTPLFSFSQPTTTSTALFPQPFVSQPTFSFSTSTASSTSSPLSPSFTFKQSLSSNASSTPLFSSFRTNATSASFNSSSQPSFVFSQPPALASTSTPQTSSGPFSLAVTSSNTLGAFSGVTCQSSSGTFSFVSTPQVSTSPFSFVTTSQVSVHSFQSPTSAPLFQPNFSTGLRPSASTSAFSLGTSQLFSSPFSFTATSSPVTTAALASATSAGGALNPNQSFTFMVTSQSSAPSFSFPVSSQSSVASFAFSTPITNKSEGLKPFGNFSMPSTVQSFTASLACTTASLQQSIAAVTSVAQFSLPTGFKMSTTSTTGFSFITPKPEPLSSQSGVPIGGKTVTPFSAVTAVSCGSFGTTPAFGFTSTTSSFGFVGTTSAAVSSSSGFLATTSTAAITTSNLSSGLLSSSSPLKFTSINSQTSPFSLTSSQPASTSGSLAFSTSASPFTCLQTVSSITPTSSKSLDTSGTAVTTSQKASVPFGFSFSQDVSKTSATTSVASPLPASYSLGGSISSVQTPKDVELPAEMKTAVQNFQKHLNEVKNIREEIRRFSARSFQKIREDILSSKKILGNLQNKINSLCVETSKLKARFHEEQRCIELCVVTSDLPLGLQLENTAPEEFFSDRMRYYEKQVAGMKNVIMQLEERIAYANTTVNSLAVKKVYNDLVSIASELYPLHVKLQRRKKRQSIPARDSCDDAPLSPRRAAYNENILSNLVFSNCPSDASMGASVPMSPSPFNITRT